MDIMTNTLSTTLPPTRTESLFPDVTQLKLIVLLESLLDIDVQHQTRGKHRNEAK